MGYLSRIPAAPGRFQAEIMHRICDITPRAEYHEKESRPHDLTRHRIEELAAEYGAARAAGDLERVRTIRQDIDEIFREAVPK
jgi:hypothetical protein